jgi:glycosyltransferase involved in cell wall biosynthesis
VSASSQEGFGYPAAEAAMVGKPIVCPDRGSLLETAGNVGIPFQAGNSAALADAILGALQPDDRAKRAWSDERARAASRFSLASAANDLLSCYELALE